MSSCACSVLLSACVVMGVGELFLECGMSSGLVGGLPISGVLPCVKWCGDGRRLLLLRVRFLRNLLDVVMYSGGV